METSELFLILLLLLKTAMPRTASLPSACRSTCARSTWTFSERERREEQRPRKNKNFCNFFIFYFFKEKTMNRGTNLISLRRLGRACWRSPPVGARC